MALDICDNQGLISSGGLYSINIEKPLERLISEVFEPVSLTNVHAQSISEYLRFVDRVIKEEQIWICSCLPEVTQPILNNALDEILIASHLGFLQENVTTLFESSDFDCISLTCLFNYDDFYWFSIEAAFRMSSTDSRGFACNSNKISVFLLECC